MQTRLPGRALWPSDCPAPLLCSPPDLLFLKRLMDSPPPSTWWSMGFAESILHRDDTQSEVWVWPTPTHYMGPLVFGFPSEKGEIHLFSLTVESIGMRCQAGLGSFQVWGLGCSSVALCNAWSAFSTKQTKKALSPAPACACCVTLKGVTKPL